MVNREKIISVLGIQGEYKPVGEVPFFLVSDDDWKKITGGKKQPSQSVPLDDDSFAVMKKSYFADDKYYWIPHEKGHCIYYFSHHGLGKDYLPYPINEVENFAFLYQFKAMKDAGLKPNECYDIIKEAYVDSDDWDTFPELEGFLKERIEKAFS